MKRIFLPKRIQIIFLIVILLLSLVNLNFFTIKTNSFPSDNSEVPNSPPVHEEVALKDTEERNWRLNWATDVMEKYHFRQFWNEINLRQSSSEQFSPLGLSEIIGLFKTIFVKLENSLNNAPNSKFALSLFAQKRNQTFHFSRLILWFLELYQQFRENNLASVVFEPQRDVNYLAEAIQKIFNLEEFYFKLSSKQECVLVSSPVEIPCPSIKITYKTGSKRAINYQSLVGAVFDLGKWIYQNLDIEEKNALNWINANSNSFDLNWEKISILLTNLKNNLELTKQLEDELVDVLSKEIKFQYSLSNDELIKASLFNRFKAWILSEIGVFVSLFASGRVEEEIQKNIQSLKDSDLTVISNGIKWFMQIILTLKEIFEKIHDQPVSFNWLEIILNYLQRQKGENWIDEEFKILFQQVLSNILNFNQDRIYFWNSHPEVEKEIQNLLNDYTANFYDHLDSSSQEEYLWNPVSPSFEGITVMPYISNVLAETHKIMVIQWIGANRQKYTIALKKLESSEQYDFDVVYFAPNHWQTPLKETLQEYLP